MHQTLKHRWAVGAMLLATLMWSSAGIVTRQIESAHAFEITFWRSASTAACLLTWLMWRQGPQQLLADLRRGPAVLWLSGLCWGLMFTAFMLALTLTTVANVLIMEALGPFCTAVLARLVLGQQVAGRTWLAIVMASVGIVWMYASQLAGHSANDVAGCLIALTVPLAGASMWTMQQHNAQLHPEARCDMTQGVLIGAALSSIACLPWLWPLQATPHDVAWLTGLGLLQLAIPCTLAVRAGGVLKAPEAALLSLLEIVFGVTWAWLGTAEQPTFAVVGGGGLVLLALAVNELLSLVEMKSRMRDR